MLQVIIQWVGSLLGGPIAKAAIDAYRIKKETDNNSERIAAELAAKELELEKRERELINDYKIATIGAWYSPDHLFGYIAVFYVGKVAIYDAALGLGSTDPIRGDVGVWFGWIMAFWLGKKAIENTTSIAARILRR